MNNKDLLEKRKSKNIYFNFNPLEIMFRPICALFNSNKKTYDLYEKCYKNIDHHLNIMFYIKLVQEIEIIKHVLFSDYDISLINFIAKPLMSYHNKINIPKMNDIDGMFLHESDIENALFAYKKKLENFESTEKDQKLINMIQEELNEILK